MRTRSCPTCNGSGRVPVPTYREPASSEPAPAVVTVRIPAESAWHRLAFALLVALGPIVHGALLYTTVVHRWQHGFLIFIGWWLLYAVMIPMVARTVGQSGRSMQRSVLAGLWWPTVTVGAAACMVGLGLWGLFQLIIDAPVWIVRGARALAWPPMALAFWIRDGHLARLRAHYRIAEPRAPLSKAPTSVHSVLDDEDVSCSAPAPGELHHVHSIPDEQ